MGKNKQPKAGVKVEEPGKKPRVGPDVDLTPGQRRPVWRIENLDLDGDWSWANSNAEHLLSVIKKLKHFESMTWLEIERNDRTGCHAIEVYKLCKEAQDRLRAIRQDDVAELFSLRITQAARVWGIRDGHAFRVLWWDPDHAVYPVNVANN